MNIPPKYEDLVFQLNELNKREAALREELEALRESYEAMRDRKNSIVDLQQRLTVAEQFVQKLVDCSKGQDSIATGYLSDIFAELKPVETLFEKGQRLFREGHGSSSLWGECSNDAELPEVHRGWMAAYDAAALKPAEAGEGS